MEGEKCAKTSSCSNSLRKLWSLFMSHRCGWLPLQDFTQEGKVSVQAV